MEANREYKDSIIRALLNSPEKALRLYCDITGKAFGSDAEVEMKSIEAQLLSKRRNDISFTVNGVLVVFFEHQATLNKNMPLRLLQYITTFFSTFYKVSDALYASTLIQLPKPEFYVLYNGKSPYPPEGEIKLSEAFMLKDDEPPGLELTVKVVNINHDSMPQSLKQNEEMRGYAAFVEKVNTKQRAGQLLSEALNQAVNECISEGILSEFFKKHKNEVESMFTLVYDEERAKKVAKEEGWLEGQQEGMEKGIFTSAIQFVKSGMNPQDVAKILNLTDQQTNKLKSLTA